MIVGTVSLLLVTLTIAGSPVSDPANCDFFESIGPGAITKVSNPEWPAKYPGGVTCRWIYDCTEEYICRLQCEELGLPQSENCYLDKLLVSYEGDTRLDDANTYCGQAYINSKSYGARLVIVLSSNEMSPGGRFRCTVQSLKDKEIFNKTDVFSYLFKL